MLAEDVLLLSVHEKKGLMLDDSITALDLPGAILMELAIEDRLRYDEAHKYIDVTDPSPTGDPILDETLDFIRTKRPTNTTEAWPIDLPGISLTERLLNRLVEKEILRCEDKRNMLVFKSKAYYLTDPLHRQAIIDRIKSGFYGGNPDPRSVVLMAVFASGDTFSREDWHTLSERLWQLFPDWKKGYLKFDNLPRSACDIISELAITIDASRQSD